MSWISVRHPLAPISHSLFPKRAQKMFAVLDLVSFWLEREPSLIQEHALYRQEFSDCPLAQSRMGNHGAREVPTPGA